MKKISFIGPVCQGSPPTDGETAKNQVIYTYLTEKYGSIYLVDTFYWKRDVKTFLKLLYVLYFKQSDYIVLSICTLSAYHLTRILFYSRVRKKLFYFVIGNTIVQGIEKKKYNPRYYSIYDKIFVEGKITQKKMTEFNLNNVEYLPNFKNIDNDLLKIKKINIKENDRVSFVFLSRITEDKGVSLIFKAVKQLNTLGLSSQFTVSFYGPVADDYKNVFIEKIGNTDNANYNGYLNLQEQKGYETLASYHVMLFPTFWEGEGFPGIIVDAFIAGLPVIASDWNLNKEIIIDGQTGIIVPARSINELTNAMIYFIQNKDRINEMSKFSRANALKYHVNNLLDKKLL